MSRCAVLGRILLRSGWNRVKPGAKRSRDQEDIASLFKRLTFAGVRIVTLAEGDITHLHIGFKSTMNALFLQDLADKTRRGLRGRVEIDKAGGGLCLGYRGVRAMVGAEVTTGDREIEQAEARTVQRIFGDFISGFSPKHIAKVLNREAPPDRVAASGVRARSTATPSAARASSTTNCTVRRMVWNWLRYVKNPDTGKRVSRLNPRAEWIATDVPPQRIVSDDAWNAAKERQAVTRHAIARTGRLASPTARATSSPA